MNIQTKRLLICLAGGVIAAGICTAGRLKLIPGITLPVLLASAVGNRMLIGLAIGISRLRMNFLLHGALMGLIVTLSYSIGMLAEHKLQGFIIYTSMGIIFGIMIETLAKVCNAGVGEEQVHMKRSGIAIKS